MHYYFDYGQHTHVITLTHLRTGVQQFDCMCGEGSVGPERVIKTLIMAHRMEHFWKVRRRLNG